MSPHLNTGRILPSRGPGQPWAASGRSRHPLKRLDEPRRDRLVRPRVLAGDELAVLDHIRLEVDRGRAHLATGDPKRVNHVEVQLGMEDALLNDLLLGNREDRHLIPGILPPPGQFGGPGRVAGDQGRPKLSRLGHGRDRGNRAVAQERRRLLVGVEVPQDLADLGILHEINRGRLAAGNEHPRVLFQPLVDHRPQRSPVVHRGIGGEEVPRSLVGRLVASEVLSRIRGLVDVWLRTVRRGEYDIVTRFDQCHGRHDGLVKVLAGRPRAATSDLDPGGIGTDHKHLSLAHNSSCCWLNAKTPSPESWTRRRPAGEPEYYSICPWETPMSYRSMG